MQQIPGVAAHVRCLLSHDLVNKLSAIIGHCDILETKDASAECLSRLQKIKELAEAASNLLNTRSCEVQAVNQILRLGQGFTPAAQSKKPPKNLRSTGVLAVAAVSR